MGFWLSDWVPVPKTHGAKGSGRGVWQLTGQYLHVSPARLIFQRFFKHVPRLPAAKRKSQLLDTAAVVFATYGFEGTTTAELAKAAGVSEPIIYRHFKSKKGMFIALVERTGEETLSAWTKSLADLGDPAERVIKLLGSNPMVQAKAAIRYRVIVQAMNESTEPDVKMAIHAHMLKLHGFITGELDAAQRAGVAKRAFSAELMAWLLIHIAVGYGTLTSVEIPGNGTDAEGRHIDDIVANLVLDLKK